MSAALLFGAAGGALQFITGHKAQQRAKSLLDRFEYQDISVSPLDQLKPSMEIERQQLQSIAAQRSQLTDVAGQLGASEAMALLSRGGSQLTEQEQRTRAQMLQQQYQYDVMRAQDAQERRRMQEARDMGEIASLQQEYTAGTQMQINALSSVGQMFAGAGTQLSNSSGEEKEDKDRRSLGEFFFGEKEYGLARRQGGVFGQDGFFSKIGGLLKRK